MISTALIWAHVACALAPSAAPGPDHAGFEPLVELQNQYQATGDRLLAAEFCGTGWQAVGSTLAVEIESPEPPSASRLAELTEAVTAATLECEDELGDRFQSALQRLRGQLRSLQSQARAEPDARVPLTPLIQRLEKLYRSVDGPAISGQQVIDLERQLRDVEGQWAGLDPCDRAFRPAMARLGSVGVSQSFEELCRIAESQCLYPPHQEMAQLALEQLVPADHDVAQMDRQTLERTAQQARTLLTIPGDRLEACLPGAKPQLQGILAAIQEAQPPKLAGPKIADTRAADTRAESVPHSTDGPVSARVVAGTPPPTDAPAIEATPSPTPPTQKRPQPRRQRAEPTVRTKLTGRAKTRTNGFVLNVWQSAWGNFSSFDEVVVPYLRDNPITEVNLNPGLGMTPDSFADAHRRLKPLVETLRRGGIQRINYLYAELNYPIERYADFLLAYPDLGIDRIVDDSEFTDHYMDRFQQNRQRVEDRGIHYSAFITLEGKGNSGVSDTSREWALRNLDQPILMSYFGCTVDEQLALLRDYLELADQLPREPGFVKIALLLGGKSTGREVSCEQLLDAAAFRDFVHELDRRLRIFPSYGGLVLETNYRLPRYSLAVSQSSGAR